MLRTMLRAAMTATALAALWNCNLPGAGRAEAIEHGYPASNQDLFYNFYAHPGPCGGVPAAMYISPVPTPAHVQHTWVTYQPFMPHQMLYSHTRKYTKYHCEGNCATQVDGGKTVTTVKWRPSPLDFKPRNF